MAASFPSSVKSFGADRVTGDYIPASDMNDVRAEIVAVETAALSGGWISDPNTWTYASASTFTVAGNQTAIFTKGTRLKWTQTSAKYGVVLSSSYSAPNTTVTIAINADYVITNAAISANSYSNLDNPRGWPDWFTWDVTLTWTAGTPPSSENRLVSRYRITGNTCFYEYSAIFTAGATVTGLQLTLPVTPNPIYHACYGNIRVSTTPNLAVSEVASGKIYIYCSSCSATRAVGFATVQF